MLELVDKLRSLTGSRARLVDKPLPSDDPRQRQSAIYLAQSKLDWEPNVWFEGALGVTIRYFEQLLGNTIGK